MIAQCMAPFSSLWPVLNDGLWKMRQASSIKHYFETSLDHCDPGTGAFKMQEVHSTRMHFWINARS